MYNSVHNVVHMSMEMYSIGKGWALGTLGRWAADENGHGSIIGGGGKAAASIKGSYRHHANRINLDQLKKLIKLLFSTTKSKTKLCCVCFHDIISQGKSSASCKTYSKLETE